MTDLRRLRAFRAWMQTGSVSLAAQQLGLSQPAVSRLLHDLAEGLNMALFVRDGRRIVPTSEAIALYDEVDQVLTGMMRIDEMSKGMRREQSRQLQIACTPAPALGILPAALKTFAAEFPDVEISMEMCIPWDLRDWAGLGNFELALSMMPMAYPDAVIEPFAKVETVVGVPPDHPLAAQKMVTRDDLRAHPVILPTRHTLICAQWQAALRVNKLPHVNDLFTTSAFSACQWAEAGLGVAVIDLFNGLAYGERLQLRPLQPILTVEYVAMFPKGRKRSATVDNFMEHLFRASRTIAAGWKQ